MFTDEDKTKSAKGYESLGPHYFSSQRAADEITEAFIAEQMKPLVNKAADDFGDKLWTMIEDHLWSDVNSNLQSKMWRTIDEIVKGILSGEEWVMKRYALGSKYECEKIRAAVAKHIPHELLSERVKDLEEENKRLIADNNFYRMRQ
jgi:hypothetical protein